MLVFCKYLYIYIYIRAYIVNVLYSSLANMSRPFKIHLQPQLLTCQTIIIIIIINLNLVILFINNYSFCC